MSEITARWFALTADVSLKVVWLAAVGGLGIAALRIRNSNVRHAVWVGVLGGMLAMPALDLMLPGLAIPVPRAWVNAIHREQVAPQAVAAAPLESAAPVASVEAAPHFNASELKLESLPIRHASERVADVRLGTTPRPTVAPEAAAAKTAGTDERTQIAAIKTQEPIGRESVRLESRVPSRIDWILIAAAVWASGASILILRLLMGHTVMRRLVRRAQPIALASPNHSSRPADALVEIREGADVVVPVTVGLFRSTILLPTAWKTWPQEKLADVLAHEQAHARRRDCLIAFVADVCVAVYWFHPLAWWLRKRLALLAEEACDDAAIGSTGNRTAYARHLLEIVSVLSGRSGRLATPGVAMARQSNIESRINAILDFNRPLSGRMTRAATLRIAAILIPLVGLSAALRPSIASEQPAASDRPAVEGAGDAVAMVDPPKTGEVSAEPSSPVAAPAAPRDEQMLTATGRVLHADGSPASDAIVSVVGERDEDGPPARAGKDGHFHLSHPFTSGRYLLASTADGRQQAVFFVAPATARVMLQSAIELKLSPAWQQQVSVSAAGKPVHDARVAVVGRYVVEKRTGPDGVATFWLPTGEKIRDIVAWHPQRGGAERGFGPLSGNAQPTEPVKLSLRTGAARTFRVVDASGNPISGFRLSFDWPVYSGNKWLQALTTWYETDSQGELTVPLLRGQARPDHPWRIIDREKVFNQNDVTEIQVARLRPVTGRLIMRSRETAEGILVSAGDFSRGFRIDAPSVRVRRDGTFTFWADSGKRYTFDINDANWASDVWSGTVLASDDGAPAAIALHVDHGIPLTVKVTKGPKSEPCPNVEIEGSRSLLVGWVDAKGQRQTWGGRIPFDLVTDTKGVAQLAIQQEATQLGSYDLKCRIGAWGTGEWINPKSKGPITVTFHRPWIEDRTIFGQMRYAGQPRPATPTTSVRAWTEDGTPLPVEIYPEGWFAVAGHAAQPWIYIKDSQKGLNGFREGSLQPTGAYSGAVVDEGGKPVKHCRVKLVNDPDETGLPPRRVVLDEVDCDDQGRFQFTTAPTSVTVCPVAVKSVGNHDEQLLHTVLHDLRLAPAEAYRDDRIVVLSQESKTAAVPKARTKSAVERLPDLLRDARLSHMQVLVVAEGDSSGPVREATRKLLDDQEFPGILRYLPLLIPAADLPAAAPLFARFSARPPAGGEILLLAVDRNGRGSGEWLLRGEGGPSAVQSARGFLKSQALPPRDARQLLAAALAEANASRREVWVTACGPRCEACFQLLRWIDDQQQPLEFDYVFVTLLVGCDQHVDEVLRSLNRPPRETRLPWFAIVGKNGGPLVTSDGPRGNIGFPETRAATRYLRQMIDRTAGTLTAAEIDRLIRSLDK